MQQAGTIGSLRSELDESRCHVRSLEQGAKSFHEERDRMMADLTRIRGERKLAQESLKGIQAQFSQMEASHQLLQAERDSTLQARDNALEAADSWRRQYEAAKAQADEAARLQIDRETVRAEAVREYRASRVLQNEKDEYAAGFKKYGFYMARCYLEQLHPGVQYPELVFGDEAEDVIVPDWRTLGDPDSTSPEEYLGGSSTELEKPAGPWTPRDLPTAGDEGETGEMPIPDSGTIGALEGIEYTEEELFFDSAPSAPE